MTRWEYQVVLGHGVADEDIRSWEKELNSRGKDGWEVVSVVVRPEVPQEEPKGDNSYNHRRPRLVVFLKRELRVD
jgi:hypothetical protein